MTQRHRVRPWWVAWFVVTAVAAAEAREAAVLRPGERAFGELAGGASSAVLVDGVAGMKFSATCRAFRGTRLLVALSLAAPDGAPVDVTDFLKSSRGGATAALRSFTFPTTGRYLLTVTSTSAAAGGFDLDTSGVLPRRIAGKSATTVGATELSFATTPGDRVKCSVRPARGVKTKPTIRRFVDADGGVADVNAPRTAKPIVVRGIGMSRFDVESAPPGAFTFVIGAVRGRPSRTPRDMAEVEAAGVLSGVAAVEGLDVDPAATETTAKRERRAPTDDLAAGELVFSFPDATTTDAVVAAAEASLPGARCTVAAAMTDRGPYLVRVEHLADKVDRRSKTATRALAKSAAASGRAAWCEPNYLVQADSSPNDPSWLLQYDFKQIRCPDAWDLTRGSPTIVVAVVDTGMTTHPDLDGAWLPGFDFVTGTASSMDGDGWDSDPFDAAYVSHGTHVAGTIGARTDDGVGITGIAPLCRILPVRVLGRSGGTTFDISAGLLWAVGLPVAGAPPNPYPANVVNMSLGGSTYSQVERDAVAAVMGQTNAVVVASAGNNGNSIPTYPASYSGVIAVSAVDSNLRLTSYSTYGSFVSIAAPGGDQSRGLHGIFSCWVDSATHLAGYRELDGTSMAAPHVAGVAALLLSVKPHLTRNEVLTALTSTALDLGTTGRDSYYGWGVVDARAALDSLVGPSAIPMLFAGPQQLTFSDSVGRLSVLIGAHGDGKITLTDVLATTDDGGGWLTASTPATVLPAIVTVEVDPNLPVGAYSGHVFVDTSIGRQDVPITVFRAAPPSVNAVTIEVRDEGGKLTGRTTTSAGVGWRWSIAGVPLGRHTITAFADLDGSIAADRVDEFLGAWPIPFQSSFVEVSAADLDHDGLVVRLVRFDREFTGIGVGGGPLAGAFAVHAVDEFTGADVTAATVHLVDGPTLAATDVRGRALVVGGYNSAQSVTLVADGYVPTSRVGFDTQFLGVKMAPVVPRPVRELATTFVGFGPADAKAFVQVADARALLVLDGSGAASITLTVPDVPGPLAVSVAAYDAGGVLTRRALRFAAPDASGLVVTADAAPPSATERSDVYALLTGGFRDAPDAGLRAEAFVRADDGRWLTLGGAPLTDGDTTSFAWSKQDAEPIREIKIEVSAHDAQGREFREIARGSTFASPQFRGLVIVRRPTQLVAPVDGATAEDATPTLKWTSSPGARIHRVTIESLDGSWRRVLLVAGSVFSVRLPSPAGAGLAAGTTYRWSVESSFGLYIDSRFYNDDDFETLADGFSSSGTATFTTKGE